MRSAPSLGKRANKYPRFASPTSFNPVYPVAESKFPSRLRGSAVFLVGLPSEERETDCKDPESFASHVMVTDEPDCRTSRSTTRCSGSRIELPGICAISVVDGRGVPLSDDKEIYDSVGEAKLEVRPTTCTTSGVTASWVKVSVDL